MALSLYRGVNYQEVLRVVTEGMQVLGDHAIRRDVGKSGISAARTRLGWPVMAHLADHVLQPLADTHTRGASVGRYRLVSLDGRTEPIMVRVIDYQLPGVPGAESIYRLMTTLLDEKEARAEALARLYHARWTIETTLAELNTTLKGADIVLRSKTPDLVRQAFYGLLLAHYAIRKLMWEAALTRDEPPERLSFKHAVNTVRRKLPAYGAIPP